ncbi:transcriptional regulator BetI [Paraburkholderia silviterrae]|uniref:HTH-type transcriptional regulator BetI n=1 Tax=Paraburkholderia silviterrae TaxID=2528715 RepID=A0A4R5M0G6_9BURK|nr:transcriptional regulator BetI [Paraburkholderia silviterrae]TDG18331.1 transcriptional regulator BetI [Paraburkholderia silviterrae]
MPSKSIRDIRRADLMEAAYLTMQEHGLSGITTARVAERAGMSTGLVHHYFKDKNELIESAIRVSTAEQKKDVLACVARARTPAERIWAIIEGNFSERGYTRPIAQGWVSFCGDACFNPRFLRIQKIVHRRMDDNLLFSLKMLLPLDQARNVALDISVMIDGFWLRLALQGTPSRSEALARMRGYLERTLTAVEP